jgi:hypothetical protein
MSVRVKSKLTNLDASLYGYNLPVRAWDKSTGRIVGCYCGPKRREGGRPRQLYYVALDGGGYRYYKARDLKPLAPVPTQLVDQPDGFYHWHYKPVTDRG